MTNAERVRIFRPHQIMQRLDRAETEFVRQSVLLCGAQAESLRIQISRGTKPRNLILDKGTVRRVADALAFSMVGTFAMGQMSINAEIIEAKAVRRGKASIFKAIRKADVPLPGGADWREFFPTRGVDWYRQYSLRLAGVQQVDALERAREIIAKGVEQGWNQSQVMNEIGQIFPDFSRGRLEMIARTETAKIYEQARWRAMDAEPEIVGYEWSAILDSRVCPICAARHGQRYPKAQVNGRLPPAHVSCRCVLLPIFNWELESGEVQYTQWPTEPPFQPGFGGTSMAIPEPRDRIVAKLIN